MKIKLIFILIITAYFCTASCSKESDNPWTDPLWGEITVTMNITQPHTKVEIYVTGEDCSIDWNDGKKPSYMPTRQNIYETTGIYQVIISGKNIIRFTCNNQPELISINTSKCPTLHELLLSHTGLTQLDVSQNYSLYILSCINSSLTSLITGSIPRLKTVTCYNNQLSQLDIKNYNSLEELYCSDNPFISLDLTPYHNLEYFSCSYCTTLTVLDVSKNYNLKSLSCSENPNLSILKINSDLEYLYCPNNKLKSLDLTKNQKLRTLMCSDNEITNLDLSQCISLKELNCSYNQLSSLELSNNKKLTSLYCTNNQLTTLDLSENRSPNFKLDCRYNPLDYIWIWKGATISPEWRIPSFAYYRPK